MRHHLQAISFDVLKSALPRGCRTGRYDWLFSTMIFHPRKKQVFFYPPPFQKQCRIDGVRSRLRASNHGGGSTEKPTKALVQHNQSQVQRPSADRAGRAQTRSYRYPILIRTSSTARERERERERETKETTTTSRPMHSMLVTNRSS